MSDSSSFEVFSQIAHRTSFTGNINGEPIVGLKGDMIPLLADAGRLMVGVGDCTFVSDGTEIPLSEVTEEMFAAKALSYGAFLACTVADVVRESITAGEPRTIEFEISVDPVGVGLFIHKD